MRGWFTDIIFRFGVRLLKFPESIRFPFGQNYSQKTKFPARKIIGWCLGGGSLTTLAMKRSLLLICVQGVCAIVQLIRILSAGLPRTIVSVVIETLPSKS